MLESVVSITEAVATVIARAHREHRISVEAAAMRLVVELGRPERLLERASLHIRGEGPDAVHELVLDGALVVWSGSWDRRRGRWVAQWCVDVARVR